MTTARTENTLTPEGARVLRAVRDQIVAHPEQFNINNWECGTKACIAGHCWRILTGREWTIGAYTHVCHVLGFPQVYGLGVDSSPLWAALFGKYWITTAELARDEINAFLWQYGYPPSEVAVAEPSHADAVAGTGA